ncbi:MULTISPECIES: DedA family protein [Limnochorda]|uniref:DedA family protein n=1 Tax=Limnochorda TaxID=1676651 RepID=UPI0017E1C6E2|nr:DedA family protein [Limnochorda pilosa]NMA72035.1 DedA family protein [Bacillota bacterium]
MVEWILGHVRTFGYPVVALGLFIDGLGLPFPGQIALLFAGFLASRGDLHLAGILLAGTVGIVAGTGSAYWLGRGQASRLHRWLERLGVAPERLRRAQAALARWGIWGYALGHFVPTLGNVTPYLAGAGRVRLLPFLVAAVLHGAAWVGLPVAAGYVLGSRWPSVAAWLGRAAEWVAVIAILGWLLVWSLRTFRTHREPA